jgi:biotin carboxylase
VLFVGGGTEAVPALHRARDMGLHVVVSDGNGDAPGMRIADAPLLASTYDVAATVEAARRYHLEVRPLAGVLCVATDVPHTVAAVAHALNLPGIPLESARLAVDKLAMKDRFRRDGVPVPWYTAIESVAQLREQVAARGYPLVIKPVDSRGARGVLRLRGEVDLQWAFDTARQESPTGRVMVEQFLAGPQVSTESIVVDGVTFTPGFSDRNYEYLDRFAPHIIENGGDLPSSLPQVLQNEVNKVVQEAANSLGIRNGVVKGDIVVSDGRVYVIEMAARLSGGYFCTHEIPLNTGVDFVAAAIRVALGEKPSKEELTPRFQRHVCQRYWFPDNGEVVSVSGEDDVRHRPGIALLELRVRAGSYVGPMNAHPARAGVVISTGETREQAQERALAALRDVLISVAVRV